MPGTDMSDFAALPAGDDPVEFGKVVIFGVGLIGGSFALGLKANGQVEEVVGFGRSIATLTQALDIGIATLYRRLAKHGLNKR